jgi:hypothetical protein
MQRTSVERNYGFFQDSEYKGKERLCLQSCSILAVFVRGKQNRHRKNKAGAEDLKLSNTEEGR